MYKQNKPDKTTLTVKNGKQGETIEMKMRRILNNKEAIKDVAPIIFTERKDGVIPQYDIRADKMEMAAESMHNVAVNHSTKRTEQIGERTFDTMTKEEQQAFKTKYPKNKLSQNPETGANTSDKPK